MERRYRDEPAAIAIRNEGQIRRESSRRDAESGIRPAKMVGRWLI